MKRILKIIRILIISKYKFVIPKNTEVLILVTKDLMNV